MTSSDDGAFLLLSFSSSLVRYEISSGASLTLDPPNIFAPPFAPSEIDNDGDRIAYVGVDPNNYLWSNLYLYDIPTQTSTVLLSLGSAFSVALSFSGNGERCHSHTHSFRTAFADRGPRDWRPLFPEKAAKFGRLNSRGEAMTCLLLENKGRRSI